MQMHAMTTLTMTLISIISALLSGMWIWADKWSDVRLSINDLYMALLMTGWMFLLQGIAMKHANYAIIGTVLVVASLFVIRFQILVSQDQYLQGMIPHHSMAVFLSKKQIEKSGNDEKILDGLPFSIVQSQQVEIGKMKQMLN
jgi:O-antigen/teichoic acid export membrane protein